jgi:hypothetical protein
VKLSVGLLAVLAATTTTAWSKPVTVDRSSVNQFESVSCPSTAQCTGSDVLGNEVTFDPSSPRHRHRHMIVQGILVACPSTSLCVGVYPHALGSHAIVLRPLSGKVLRDWRIAKNTNPNAVTCFSTHQCTAMGTSGHETTFDPSTGKGISSGQEGTQSGLGPVSCPTATQCTAINSRNSFTDHGDEVTFNPKTGAVNAMGVQRNFVSDVTQGIACASAAQCTAVGANGQEVTFDPTTAQVNAAGYVALGGNLIDVSCASVTQCTAISEPGKELTFDPSTGALNSAGITSIGSGNATVRLACPAATQCTAVGNGKEATFDPGTGTQSSAAFVDHGGDLLAIACPGATECVAIDRSTEFTLHLGKRVRVSRHVIDPKGFLDVLSCPSATQCTATDFRKFKEFTFNPATGALNAAGGQAPDPGHALDAVCPTTTKCVALDDAGNELTFDPATGKATSALHAIGTGFDFLACPSARQCTVVKTQEEVTFKPGPASFAVIRTASLVGTPAYGINGFACPSTSECVAVDSFGEELAFAPRTGHVLNGGVRRIDSHADLMTGLACLSMHRCIATDWHGGTSTFDPTSPARSRTAIPFAANPEDVACTPTGRCVVVDDGGNAFVQTGK